MRSKLLISTAALVAGVALASAQTMPGGAQSQGAPSGGGQAGQERQSQPPGTQRGQDKGQAQGQKDQSQPQRGQKDQTTGQAPQGQRDQKGQGKDGQTTGQRDQSPGQRDQSPGQTQQRQQSPTQGQAPQRQEGQQAQPPQQGQPGQAQQGQAGGNVTLNAEQRTKIRQTVLTSGAPRVSNVNFSISVGTAVPSSVRVVTVPDVLVEIHPQWRGYMYFVVGDQIIIVDRNHRIVAVLTV